MKKTVEILFAMIAMLTFLVTTVAVIPACAADAAQIARLDLSATETLLTYTNGTWPAGMVVAKDQDGNPVSNESLTFTSSYEAVLSVSASGAITPVHEGYAVITATYTNPDRSTVSASLLVTAANTVHLNNQFESGSNLALNFSRTGSGHSVQPGLSSTDEYISSNINTQSYVQGTYRRFLFEVWFYDDGVITSDASAGAKINLNAWDYGNATLGVLDKSSPYYSYTNVQGARTSAAQLTPAIRNEITYLNGAPAYSAWPYSEGEAYLKRSAGWHQLTVCCAVSEENRNLLKYYIDGVEVMSENFNSNLQTLKLGAADGACYDDARLVSFSSSDLPETGNIATDLHIYGANAVGETLTARADLCNPYDLFAEKTAASAVVPTKAIYYDASGKGWENNTFQKPVYSWSDATVAYHWYSSPDGQSWNEIGTGSQYTLDEADNNRLVKAAVSVDGRTYESNVLLFGALPGETPHKVSLITKKYNDADAVSYDVADLEAVADGTSVTFTVTPAVGSIISAVRFGGAPQAVGTNEYEARSFTLSTITEDIIVEIEFAQRPAMKPELKTYSFVTGTQDGYKSAVYYQKLNPGYGWEITDAGVMLSNGTDTLRLSVTEEVMQSVSDSGAYAFGIKVYGPAFDHPGRYVFVPYIEMSQGGEEPSTETNEEATEEFVVEESN